MGDFIIKTDFVRVGYQGVTLPRRSKMPVLNRISELQEEVVGWRRHLHRTPELLFDVHQTAAFVTEKLHIFGCDAVETGIGRSGVVGIIKGNCGEGPVVGFRADMDALPIQETCASEWASAVPGIMHACGHDGHTAMLLGAAKYLAETRNFRGSIAVIFQPAEEGGGGGLEMVNDGVMEKFSIAQVYSMHNRPGLPIGSFATRKGAVMAASDDFEIVVHGRGGHASQPHSTVDPVVIAAHVIIGLQMIASRETNPLKSVVVTVATMHAGEASNVIPSHAALTGTMRTLAPEIRDFAKKRLSEIATGIAAAYGAQAEVRYRRGYPIVVNHAEETERVIEILRKVAGEAVDADVSPAMGAEDFSYMLQARPGTLVFIGNGDTASLHNPAYDFNDEAISFGISYWVSLAETILAECTT
jgi:amidohydrolase